MSLIFKKQYPEFEENEFTESEELTFEQTIIQVKEYDWDTENSKSEKIIEEHAEPSIRLKNNQNQILDIFRGDEEKYTLIYASGAIVPRSSTSFVSGLGSLIEIIKLFENSDKDLLIKRLKAAEYYYRTPFILDLIRRFIRGEKVRYSRETITEDYSYRIKLTTVLNKLTWSFLFFLMAPVIWLFSGNDRPFDLSAFLWVQILSSVWGIPDCVLTWNYLKKNGGWTLYFRKRENTFILVTSKSKEIFDKKDFTIRIKTENKSNAPWNSFEYTTLVKNDGRQIHLSNLLIKSSEIDKLFGRLEEKTESKGFQIIRDKEVTAANNVYAQFKFD